MKAIFILSLLYLSNIYAHVPILILPIDSYPLSSHYIGQSDISRTVFSELTDKDSFIVLNLTIKESEKSLFELFTPHCKNISRYEIFQPTALVIKGDLPWKLQGETNQNYFLRLEALSLLTVDSNYAQGARPQFYEEFANMRYWVGGKWKGEIEAGLYSIVVFDRNGHTGVFNISMNEKEDWTPDLFRYVAKVLPNIKKGFCSPGGYSGNITKK